MEGLITGFCPREIFFGPDLIPNLRQPSMTCLAVIQTPFPMENAVPVLFPFADGISFNVDLCSKFLAGSALDQHFLGAFALECR